MKISKNGLNLIKEFEGCQLKAYLCPAGVVTIGWGTTNADSKVTGLTITMGTKITQKKADEMLEKTVNSKYTSSVDKYMKKYNFNQNQYDALVSFAYNIGSIDQLTSNGTRSIAEISNKILLYNKANGKELPGLTRRRKAEKKLFDTPVTVKEVNKSTKVKSKKSVTLTVTANSGLNCRKQPDALANILGVFKCGEKVELLEKTNSTWYKVKGTKYTGYCSSKYLK